jgi:hypothetical protein
MQIVSDSGLQVSPASGSLVDDQLEEESAMTEVVVQKSDQSKLKILLHGPTLRDPSAGVIQLRNQYKGKPARKASDRHPDQPCTGTYLDQYWIGKRVNQEQLVSTLSNCVWVVPGTDLSCLKGDLWVTDEVINGFLCILSNEHSEHGYFSTFFYTVLHIALQLSNEAERHSELTRLCRWPGMSPKKGKPKLKREYYVPINIDNYHYAFVHADLQSEIVPGIRDGGKATHRKAAVPTLTYYDSFSGNFQACLDDLEVFFRFMAGHNDGSYPELQCAWLKKNGKSPIQHDSWNCGLFVCAGIDCLSSGRHPQGYGSANMSAFRVEVHKLFTAAGVGIQS